MTIRKPANPERIQEPQAVLPAFLAERRWFRSKAAKMSGARITDVIPVPHGKGESRILVVEVRYLDADAEEYLLPLSYAEGQRARDLLDYDRAAVVARLETGGARARVRELHAEAAAALHGHGWGDGPLAALAAWLLGRQH